MNIMEMPNGTIIQSKRSKKKYELLEWINEDCRKLRNVLYVGNVDVINRFTQNDYTVVQSEDLDNAKL